MTQQIGKALKQLIAVTRPRPDQSEGSVAAMAERFLAVFSEYPEPIVLGALNAWPKHSEWFPTEKELRELLDYLRLNDDKSNATTDARGRRDKPHGLTKHFYDAVSRIRGEAYARSWLRGGVTAMFTDRYIYVSGATYDRLWRDLSDLIREHGVVVIEDADIAKLTLDYIERNNLGSYQPKRRRG